MGLEVKIMHFRWIENLIAINQEEIDENTMNFELKSWWTFVRHRLCPTSRENILNLLHVVLVEGLIGKYEFDVDRFISRDI